MLWNESETTVQQTRRNSKNILSLETYAPSETALNWKEPTATKLLGSTAKKIL